MILVSSKFRNIPNQFHCVKYLLKSLKKRKIIKNDSLKEKILKSNKKWIGIYYICMIIVLVSKQ